MHNRPPITPWKSPDKMGQPFTKIPSHQQINSNEGCPILSRKNCPPIRLPDREVTAPPVSLKIRNLEELKTMQAHWEAQSPAVPLGKALVRLQLRKIKEAMEVLERKK